MSDNLNKKISELVNRRPGRGPDNEIDSDYDSSASKVTTALPTSDFDSSASEDESLKILDGNASTSTISSTTSTVSDYLAAQKFTKTVTASSVCEASTAENSYSSSTASANNNDLSECASQSQPESTSNESNPGSTRETINTNHTNQNFDPRVQYYDNESDSTIDLNNFFLAKVCQGVTNLIDRHTVATADSTSRNSSTSSSNPVSESDSNTSNPDTVVMTSNNNTSATSTTSTTNNAQNQINNNQANSQTQPQPQNPIPTQQIMNSSVADYPPSDDEHDEFGRPIPQHEWLPFNLLVNFLSLFYSQFLLPTSIAFEKLYIQFLCLPFVQHFLTDYYNPLYSFFSKHPGHLLIVLETTILVTTTCMLSSAFKVQSAPMEQKLKWEKEYNQYINNINTMAAANSANNINHVANSSVNSQSSDLFSNPNGNSRILSALFGNGGVPTAPPSAPGNGWRSRKFMGVSV